jgi:toxin-antitoxin system PIN domain toxin
MARYLPDTNVWLALAVSGHTHHVEARRWLDSLAGGDELVLSRAGQQSLLRLLTTRAVFAPMGSAPLTNVEAWAVVDAVAADRRVGAIVAEPAAITRTWREYSSLPTSSPKVWMDAYLAAFARASGAVLVTIDVAFRAFADLESIVIEPPLGRRAPDE